MIRDRRNLEAQSADGKKEIQDEYANRPMTVAGALRIVGEERDEETGKTIFQHMEQLETDTALGRRLHQVAMKLCQYGVEVVKQQFDAGKLERMVDGMRKNRILSKMTIPEVEYPEFFDWISETITETLMVLRGEELAERRHTELVLAPSVRESMIALLGQEYGEFALVVRCWRYVFLGEELATFPTPHSLFISGQDYLRSIEDAIGELIDAYNIYTGSERWTALRIDEELAIQERLYRTLEALRDFLEAFRDYDDEVTRNMPNPIGANKDADREAVRRMSQPLRLRLKGVNNKLSAVRIEYLSKLKEVKLAENRSTIQQLPTMHSPSSLLSEPGI